MVTPAEVYAAILGAEARGIGEIPGLTDAMVAAGVDPRAFVLVESSVWLWLQDAARGMIED